MKKGLLVLGEGREAASIKEIMEAIDGAVACGKSFTGNSEEEHREYVRFLVPGKENDLSQREVWEQLVISYPFAAVAIPEPKQRLDAMERLEEYGYWIATLIHPESSVSPVASLGKGCIVHPMAVIEAGAALGAGVWVKAGAVVEGNCLVGDVCCLESGSIVKSGSIVPPGTTVRSGEVFCRDAAEVFAELQAASSGYSFEVGM